MFVVVCMSYVCHGVYELLCLWWCLRVMFVVVVCMNYVFHGVYELCLWWCL